MRVVLMTATGIAVAVLALVLTPISQIRAQQSRAAASSLPPPSTPSSAVPAPVPAEAPQTIQISDELVRARIVRSPSRLPQPRPQLERRRPAQQRSLLARLFFGSGDHRPKPFPRPGS